MKKIFYLLVLILMITFAEKADAGFFDSWFNILKGSSTTVTTKKQIVEDENIKIVETNKNNGICLSNEMTIGSENSEVKRLQQFLYDKGLYKEGLITGYFGALTKKAVVNFQNAHFNEILKPAGLKKATGYVGLATLKKLNELLDCNTSINTIPINTKNDNTIPTISFVTDTTGMIYSTNTTVGKKNIFDPTGYTIDVSKIDPDNAKLCAAQPAVSVCSFMDFNRYMTLPNNCFIEKLGYKKICDGPCPCKDILIAFPDGTNRKMDGGQNTENVIVEKNETTTATTSTITRAVKKYSCSLGKCIENLTGAFLTSDCNGFCNASTKRYDCNSKGACIEMNGGEYTNSSCDNECKASNKKLLEEIFYDKSRANGSVWYFDEKIGNFYRDTLVEDKTYYPRLQILDPVSVKSSLGLKEENIPRERKSGCWGSGLIKACYEGTFPKTAGFEVIDSFSKLNTYLTIKNSSTFTSNYFDNNVLVLVFYSLNESEMLCRIIITDFKVDRVVYNVADMDEIYATNDTTPYNYQLSKYDTIIVKATARNVIDNTNICALKCTDKLKYYFDVVSIAKKDLKKIDGGYKKINVNFETEGGNCFKQ